MTTEGFSTAVARIAQASANAVAGAKTWNGTIKSYDPTTNLAKVVLDGDTTPLQALVAGEFRPSTNDRVLVLLAPPSAAFIVGTLTTAADAKGFPRDMLFSRSGTLTAVRSGRWPIDDSDTVFEIVAALETAGTTSTTFTFLVNSVVVATGTISANEKSARVDVLIPVKPRDYAQVEITTAGTGAKDLTVKARAIGSV